MLSFRNVILLCCLASKADSFCPFSSKNNCPSFAQQQQNQLSSSSSSILKMSSTNNGFDGDGRSGDGGSGIEILEFKIFPDGRIEETVRGVKGNNCEKITEDINSKLGEVVSSTPTEEMFETEVRLDNTVELTEGDGSNDWKSSSW